MAPQRPPAEAPSEEAIADAIKKLSPAEAEVFLYQLERAILRRKVQLWGYLAALVVWVVSMFFALAFYGAADPESFRAWIFAMPFAGVGVVLLVVGTVADRIGKARPPKPLS
jgi:small-conductance mechanosensitive channel